MTVSSNFSAMTLNLIRSVFPPMQTRKHHCWENHGFRFPNNQTNPHSNLLKGYIKWSTVINAIFVVFVPIFMAGTCNLMLLYTIWARRRLFAYELGHGRNERTIQQRVTITVCAIVTCFTLTQVRKD
jgi:hypothetical protein